MLRGWGRKISFVETQSIASLHFVISNDSEKTSAECPAEMLIEEVPPRTSFGITNSENGDLFYLLVSKSTVTLASFDNTMLLPPMPKSERFILNMPLNEAALPEAV
jgi:hypothetical protein